MLFRAAHIYAEAGPEAKAAELANELDTKFEAVPQSWAKLVRGELELRRGKAREAVDLFTESRKLAENWLVRFDLGRAYLAAKAYTQANSEFDARLKRQGEAPDIFLDVRSCRRRSTPFGAAEVIRLTHFFSLETTLKIHAPSLSSQPQV